MLPLFLQNFVVWKFYRGWLSKKAEAAIVHSYSKYMTCHQNKPLLFYQYPTKEVPYSTIYLNMVWLKQGN